MSYTSNTWATGDTVTAEKLNHIEQGIASGGVLVVTDTEGTLDKTWQEIRDAGFCVLIIPYDEVEGLYNVCTLSQIGFFESIYALSFHIQGTNADNLYEASSPSGYPAKV